MWECNATCWLARENGLALLLPLRLDGDNIARTGTGTGTGKYIYGRAAVGAAARVTGASDWSVRR